MKWAVATLALAGAMFCCGMPARAADPPPLGWLYRAAEFSRRLDEIRWMDTFESKKANLLKKLWEEVNAYAPPAEGTGRTEKNYEAFKWLFACRMNQLLSAEDRVFDAPAAYERAKAALAPEDLVLFEQLLDPPPLDRPYCKIEPRDVPEGRGHGPFQRELRVRAVDFPIRDLLTRMAEAGGIGIEIPPEVGGVADFSHERWQRVDGVISLFCAPRGLHFAEVSRRVTTPDPLYGASLRERAAALPQVQEPDRPDEGIQTGHVLLFGRYVPPPYVLDVATIENKVVVRLNGVPVDSGGSLTPREPPPIVSKDNIKDHTDLSLYVGQQYSAIKQESGEAEARKQISEFLKDHPMVRSFEFVRGDIRITSEDGRSWFLLLSSFGPPKPLPDAATRERLAQEHRQTVLDEAERRKAAIEKTLGRGGLMVASGNRGAPQLLDAEQAAKALATLCHSLDEVERQQQRVREAIWRTGTLRECEEAWEIFLNCRQKELRARLGARE